MQDIDFWKSDYIKRFQIDREGRELINFIVSADKKIAEQFIKNKYQREVYREDIIDTYCDRYNNIEINNLLKYLEYDALTNEEIKNYEITVKEEKQKPKCALIGQDGNIFNLMGIASRTLKQNGMKEEAKEMTDKITASARNYNEALCIIGEYVEITDEAGLEEDDEEWQE